MKENVFNYLNMYVNDDINTQQINNIDWFILSLLSYVPFELEQEMSFPLSIKDAHEALKKHDYSKLSKRKKSEVLMFSYCVNSKRYGDISILDCLNVFNVDDQEQFFAIAFLFNEHIFVSFRGTDSTIVGWKEDLNMCLLKELPAQKDATLFLQKICEQYPNYKVSLGGHSKGGNLAIYSASKIDSIYHDNILNIFSYDGPGFSQEFYLTNEYKAIDSKVVKYVPESSIIGMLLYNNENYYVIKSDSISLLQHDPFTWLIKNNDFIYVDKVKDNSSKLSEAINCVVLSETEQRRKFFCDTVYNIFVMLDIHEFRNFRDNLVMFKNSIKRIRPLYQKLTVEEKSILIEIYRKFFEVYRLQKDSKIETKKIEK